MTLGIHPPVTDWRVIARLQRIWDEIDNGDSGFGAYTTTLRKLGVVTVSQETLLDRLCSRALRNFLDSDDYAYRKRIKIFFTGVGLSPNQIPFAPVCETRLEQRPSVL